MTQKIIHFCADEKNNNSANVMQNTERNLINVP